MNQKRRLFVLLTLSFAALPGLGAETVIDQLFGLRNYELADAYWSAGQKFSDLGQAARAEEFKAKAKRLFPGYVPGQAPSFQAVPAAAPVAAPRVPEPAAIREKNLQGEKIARLQFQKLLRGYLTGTASTVASVLGTSVEVQGQVSSPTVEAVKTFLETHPAEAGAPEDLYQVETLEVVDGVGQQVVVTVAANPAASLDAVFPFWKPVQTFTFDRIGETWKLVRIEGR